LPLERVTLATLHEDALIAALQDAPADDQPRLAYADWLDARKDVRGELIRVQCQLMKPRPRRVKELRARERRLLEGINRARPEWAAEWPPPYERGFARQVVARDLATLLAHASEIRRQHPLAEVALPDGSIAAASDDGARYALLTRDYEGAGVTLDNYSGCTTTKITVFDRGGRILHEESYQLTEWASGSGEFESGEIIRSIALSADGKTLRLKLASGPIVRSLV
jgi:uncharacterized protein (TIGR02996 family)